MGVDGLGTTEAILVLEQPATMNSAIIVTAKIHRLADRFEVPIALFPLC
jgi:hypothetical protein